MSMHNNPTGPGAGDRAGSEASGKHQGERRPSDDQRAQQAQDGTGLSDQGDALDDELGDRGGNGVPTADVRSDGNDDEDNERR